MGSGVSALDRAASYLGSSLPLQLAGSHAHRGKLALAHGLPAPTGIMRRTHEQPFHTHSPQEVVELHHDGSIHRLHLRPTAG